MTAIQGAVYSTGNTAISGEKAVLYSFELSEFFCCDYFYVFLFHGVFSLGCLMNLLLFGMILYVLVFVFLWIVHSVKSLFPLGFRASINVDTRFHGYDEDAGSFTAFSRV